MPEKICSAVDANILAASSPNVRTGKGKTGGRLMSARAIAQSPLPAPKDGTLASRSIVALDKMTPSPMAKTRKPAATRSCPIR